MWVWRRYFEWICERSCEFRTICSRTVSLWLYRSRTVFFRYWELMSFRHRRAVLFECALNFRRPLKKFFSKLSQCHERFPWCLKLIRTETRFQVIYKKKIFSPTSGSGLNSRIKVRNFFLPHFFKKSFKIRFSFWGCGASSEWYR